MSKLNIIDVQLIKDVFQLWSAPHKNRLRLMYREFRIEGCTRNEAKMKCIGRRNLIVVYTKK